MPEIDKLRKMLDKAGIPYESIIEPIEFDRGQEARDEFGEAAKYRHNQIIYGREPNTDSWKFDAIWQY